MSYHDVYITTDEIKRTSIFNLPFGHELSCDRVRGWTLWFHWEGDDVLLAGEYETKGLRLDVGGHVILDTLTQEVMA